MKKCLFLGSYTVNQPQKVKTTISTFISLNMIKQTLFNIINIFYEKLLHKKYLYV
jgi:hypothetical protein